MPPASFLLRHAFSILGGTWPLHWALPEGLCARFHMPIICSHFFLFGLGAMLSFFICWWWDLFKSKKYGGVLRSVLPVPSSQCSVCQLTTGGLLTLRCCILFCMLLCVLKSILRYFWPVVMVCVVLSSRVSECFRNKLVRISEWSLQFPYEPSKLSFFEFSGGTISLNGDSTLVANC